MDSETRKLSVARLSVFSNSALVLLKLSAGILIGSVSIISEAIHSVVDLMASLIAFVSVKKSSMPADMEHPFGHGKIENISATVEAILIFFAATWIIYESVYKILNPQTLEYVGWGVVVMFISMLVTFAVSQSLFKVAQETDSAALEADAWHLRTDVYTSAGVFVSLFLIWVSHFFAVETNVYWLDPVAAIVVALVIIKNAYRLTLKSFGDLIDTKLPSQEETWITQLISNHHPLIKGFHRLRTRKAGPFRFIDFHIKLDPRMTVEESHRITEELTEHITQHFPGASVTIHTEPCNEGKCAHECLSGCLSFYAEMKKEE